MLCQSCQSKPSMDVSTFCRRCDVMHWCRRLFTGPFRVLDTETTGTGIIAEILSIAILDEAGAVLLDTPVRPLAYTRHDPDYVWPVCNIRNGDLVDAPGWSAIYSQVRQLLDRYRVVSYNSTFDDRMVLWECSRLHEDAPLVAAWHCAMTRFAQYVGEPSEKRRGYRWWKLTEATAEMGIPHEGAHGALGDCRATLALLRAMAEGKEPVR